MAADKKLRLRAVAMRRLLSVVLVTLLGVLLLIFVLRTNKVPDVDRSTVNYTEDRGVVSSRQPNFSIHIDRNELSIKLEKRNRLPPRNLDLYPNLAKDHIPIVLYVHNRPQYLKIVVQSLSKVVGISETLLIVSHDGYFEQMNKIVEGIKFCQVKQIFSPYSPHLFPDRFPGVSPRDCTEKEDASEKHCVGNPDQYGNHRSPKIVSLKHHWWWMMNTVWDGLEETRHHSGHIVFIEEDHYIYPNAYRNLQLLAAWKEKCPQCYAVNLAPSVVNSRGEKSNDLYAERMGNIGYAFNRTVWNKIHNKAREYCFFDEYNWDITMWVTVYPSFGSPVYSLRGPRNSAVHFGKCGLHQGQGEKDACIVNGEFKTVVEEIDRVVNVNPDWQVYVYRHQEGYQAGFKGWGGWGDKRDQSLCLNFASMYHSGGDSTPDRRYKSQ